MQQKERPSMQRNSPQVEAVLSGWDKEMEKDKLTLKNLWLKTGDIVRDVDTANKMAKDKFDGDSALMHAARGAITTGVGVGLEKSMEYLWDRIWMGDIPFYDKSRFGEGMANALSDFATRGRLQARLAHLIKESTEDMSIAIFYNFLAFRGQPLLPKAGPEHLVRSIGLDAAEAFLAPHIPEQMSDKSHALKAKIATSEIDRLKQAISNDSRVSTSRREDRIQGEGFDIFTTYEFQDDMDENRRLLDIARDEKNINEYYGIIDPSFNPTKTERLIRGLMNASNPVTQLGGEWLVASFNTWKANFDMVRKMRNEKGGLLGKKVDMPKKETSWKKDDRGWQDRRPQSDRRQYDDKKTVYYGKSRWGEEKRLEEYELKGS